MKRRKALADQGGRGAAEDDAVTDPQGSNLGEGPSDLERPRLDQQSALLFQMLVDLSAKPIRNAARQVQRNLPELIRAAIEIELLGLDPVVLLKRAAEAENTLREDLSRAPDHLSKAEWDAMDSPTFRQALFFLRRRGATASLRVSRWGNECIKAMATQPGRTKKPSYEEARKLLAEDFSEINRCVELAKSAPEHLVPTEQVPCRFWMERLLGNELDFCAIVKEELDIADPKTAPASIAARVLLRWNSRVFAAVPATMKEPLKEPFEKLGMGESGSEDEKDPQARALRRRIQRATKVKPG